MQKKRTLKTGKILILFTSLVILGLLIFLTVDFTLPPRIVLKGTTLHIRDTYAQTIDLHGATAELTDVQIVTVRRNAGTSFGNVKKGSFTLKGSVNNVYLSLCDATAPYIRIDCGEKNYYINCKTQTKTESLYSEIMKVLSVTEEVIVD